jgi:S-adenosylmethionine uptake transporter
MQALWMVLASLLFATMGVGVKVAAQSFNVAELVFYRGLISIIFTAAVMRARGTPLATPVPGMHAWRTLVGTLSLGAWFYAIAYLPLATAMTLNYMSGVWIAAFLVGGALVGANPPASAQGQAQAQAQGQAQRQAQGQGPLVLTVLAAFAGVVMLLRPTIAQNQLFGGLIGLLSGIGAALAYLQVTALARVGEPASRTVFYFAIGTALGGLAGMVFMGVTPWRNISAAAAWWIVPIGLLASVGQWCMTRAYSQGPTLVAANLQYSGIVFAAMYGLLLFGDVIPLIGWAGMALIVASGIAATVLTQRALPDNHEEQR